jgi:uncharacterized protein YjiS (DUF1127 family)
MTTQDANRHSGVAENSRSIDVSKQDALTAELTGRRSQATTIAVFFSRVAQSFAAAVRIISLQGELSRNYAHLHRLDDRMLADIGIDRDNLAISLQRQRDRTKTGMSTSSPAGVGSIPASVCQPPVSGAQIPANGTGTGEKISRAA